MAKHRAVASSSSKTGIFDTPVGRTYLENLERLNPTTDVRQAVKRAREEDERRRDEDSD